MKIYKITKPGINEIYIGQTDELLNKRLDWHFKDQKKELKKPLDKQRQVYKWLDKTCIIELIEEFDSTKKDGIKEMEYVNYYESIGYITLNIYKGNFLLDPIQYMKNSNNKHNQKTNSIKTSEYSNWANKICQTAKKLGLTSKEYKKQFNIPDYSGNKKIIINDVN